MDPVDKTEAAECLMIGGRTVRILKADASSFRAAFSRVRPGLPFGEFTVPPDRYDYENAENYLTEDGLAGFSVSRAGWLQSVFSALPERGFLKAAGPLMIARSNKLNCMVGSAGTARLVKAYEACGFVTCARTTDDSALLRRLYGDAYVDRFLRDHGIPHHVYMVNREWRSRKCPECGGMIGSDSGIPVFGDYYDGKRYTALLAEMLSESDE